MGERVTAQFNEIFYTTKETVIPFRISYVPEENSFIEETSPKKIKSMTVSFFDLDAKTGKLKINKEIETKGQVSTIFPYEFSTIEKGHKVIIVPKGAGKEATSDLLFKSYFTARGTVGFAYRIRQQ